MVDHPAERIKHPSPYRAPPSLQKRVKGNTIYTRTRNARPYGVCANHRTIVGDAPPRIPHGFLTFLCILRDVEDAVPYGVCAGIRGFCRGRCPHRPAEIITGGEKTNGTSRTPSPTPQKTHGRTMFAPTTIRAQSPNHRGRSTIVPYLFFSGDGDILFYPSCMG